MDGNAAPGVRQRLDAWRAQGADRVDPVRFALIESLARRAGAHEGLARRLLDERLSGLVEDYARDVAASAPVDASGTRDPAAAGALATLLARMPHRAMDGAPYPELPLLQQFRTLWAGLRTESQLRQSLEPVAGDAGPLNSAVLVHRSLNLMRTLSPGYLQHFIAYIDALSSLERMRPAHAPTSAETGPRAEAPRKPARSRARRKPRG